MRLRICRVFCFFFHKALKGKRSDIFVSVQKAAAFHFCLLTSIDPLLYPEKETNLRSFILRDLLPSSVDGYYRYTGSLTTPPCSKVVEWIIFSRPVYLSHSQVCQVHTHTHRNTHAHTSRQVYSPRTVRSHLHTVRGSLASPQCRCTSNFSPHLPLLSLPLFPRSSPTPLHMKPQLPIYSG